MTNIYELEAKVRVKVPDNSIEDAKVALAALLKYIGLDAYEIECVGEQREGQ
jgi:hypothetical protein